MPVLPATSSAPLQTTRFELAPATTPPATLSTSATVSMDSSKPKFRSPNSERNSAVNWTQEKPGNGASKRDAGSSDSPEAQVSSALAGVSTELIPARVSSALDAVSTQLIPDRVSSALDAVSTQLIPDRVSSALEAVSTQLIPARVSSAQAEVSTQAIASSISSLVNAHTSTLAPAPTVTFAAGASGTGNVNPTIGSAAPGLSPNLGLMTLAGLAAIGLVRKLGRG